MIILSKMKFENFRILVSETTHEVVKKFCLVVEFIDKAAQTKASRSPKYEQRIEP